MPKAKPIKTPIISRPTKLKPEIPPVIPSKPTLIGTRGMTKPDMTVPKRKK